MSFRWKVTRRLGSAQGANAEAKKTSDGRVPMVLLCFVRFAVGQNIETLEVSVLGSQSMLNTNMFVCLLGG